MNVPLLLRSGLRYHLRHRWQLALSLLGIALGVAVVVAVDVATGSSRRAFELSTEAVSGRATHEITGGPGGIPDSLFARVVIAARADSAAPVIDRYIRVRHGAGTGRVIRLLGIDPFSDGALRGYVAPAAGGVDFNTLLTVPAVLLAAGTAAELGVAPGDTLDVAAGARTSAVVLAGILQPDDALAARALADVMLADISTAQEVSGAWGRLDRIELRFAGAGADEAAARVRAVLPAGARLAETAVRTGATARLTRAFDTNLTALALVALVFGMFLIYNSVTFSVVQRRPLLGLMRALGVSRRELFTLLIAEAVLLGLVATVAGIGIGYLLGTGLVTLVARTVNDLYFAVSVSSVQLPAASFVKALVLGIGATVLAAVPPAREALHARPRSALSRSTLERGQRGAARRLLVPGLVTAAVAGLLLAMPSRSIILGFAGLFVLILAAALLVPVATLALMAAVRPLAGRTGPLARLAVRNVPASLSRTAPAIAALAVSLAVGIAVTAMITSFRAGVATWLERTLQADVYVSAPGFGAGRNNALLDSAFVAALPAADGVLGISTYRHATILAGDDFTLLIAVRLHAAHRDAFEILQGAAGAWRAFDGGDILVSEPFAYRRGVGAGDSVTLPTDRGEHAFRVAGVYRDYASEHGVIFMHRDTWDRWWDDRAVTSTGVFVEPGVDPDAVIRSMRALPGGDRVIAQSNAALRTSSLEVFDRTFAITGVLRVLALLVAFVGVTGALMALQLERAREIAVLRTAGLTPAQVWRLITGQTALMGLAAAVLAVPLGIAMAWAMVHVINRRSFGWTFDLLLGPAPLAQAFATGIGAALLAGLYPAWRMSRTAPARALREE